MLSSSEKPVERPRDWLEVSSILLRAFQWVSAGFVYTSVSLRLSQISAVQDDRVRTIEPLMTIVLTYSTLALLIILCLKNVEKLRTSWHVFAMASLPTDMVMLGLMAGQHVIFSIRTFECAAVVKAGHQSSEYFTIDVRSKIYDLAHSLDTDEDGCLFPRGVYSLCILAFFSYLITIMLNIAQLLQYRKSTVSEKDQESHPGHIEAQIARLDRSEISPRSTTPMSMLSVHSVERSSLPQRPAPTQEPKYAGIPADMVARMSIAPSRTSQETTSTMDPEMYLVSDGFRPLDQPPEYSSRPGSIRTLPEYSSRPPSLHTTIH